MALLPFRSTIARGWLAAALMGVLYFALAAFTIRFTRFDGGVAFVWVSTALLLARLILLPTARWGPPLLCCGVASVVATMAFGLGTGAALPLATINLAEAAAGAWCLKRRFPTIGSFGSLAEVGTFIVVAGIAIPAISALGGAACAVAATGTGFWSNWVNWFTGHGLGTITFAPLLILAFRGEPISMAREAGRRGVGEAMVLLVILTGVTGFVFVQTKLPLLFLPFLPMMIAVFRLGRMGAVVSTAIVATIGTALTIKDLGPISLIVGGDGARAQFLQFYLATAVLIVLPAAAELKRRRQMLVSLQATSALQQLILDRTSDIIMRLEVDGTIIYVSPSISRVGGYAPEQLVGRKPHDLVMADDVDAVVTAHRRALACPSETFIVQYRAMREGGELGWFETHTRATVDEEDRPTGVVSIIHEISERVAAQQELQQMATTDALTGLKNRRAFDLALGDVVEQVGANERPGCVTIFDLDHFKTVNDRFGHAIGDLVITEFADVLRSTVRGNDIVARFGGEEFVVLLDATLDQATVVCERVRARFEQRMIQDVTGQRVFATVSAGLAPIVAGHSAAAVLKAADEALYRSKHGGRNRLTLAA
ncbi:GGDEF domain-containing protein [Sphingomonas oligophenolica]|nr:sensor domain-containing diguanylate cyclase [Sphingomonas oligophenolica]